MAGEVLEWAGRKLAGVLNAEIKGYEPATPPDARALARVVQPGDVLLIEGNSRVSGAIKYLTQSTWSHAAIHVGRIPGRAEADGEPHVLIEAYLGEGVVSAPLSRYATAHVRICRPVALEPEDREAICAFMIGHLGLDYDTKNVVDLVRYLVPLPVPTRFRRKMIALGSGDPTRAICSTLIAQAFQSVRYPILARVRTLDDDGHVKSRRAREEILHIRHHTLYTPRDFDISPYFAVVKPTIETGFDYKRLAWSERDPLAPEDAAAVAVPSLEAAGPRPDGAPERRTRGRRATDS